MYKKWNEKQGSSLLWVSADPGCGKSVLSSFLVNKFRESHSQDGWPGIVCFFFFRDDSEEQKNATSALRALLHQLFEAKSSLIAHAMPKFRSQGLKFKDDPAALWEIFTTAATDPNSGNVVCVLDGLDECEQSTRSMLMRFLVDFYSHAEPESEGRGGRKGHLKTIVTSRPYRSIEDGFHDLPKARLRGENETNVISKDIECMVDERVKTLCSKRKLSGSVQKDLKDRLIRGEKFPRHLAGGAKISPKGSDRTFLWVSLVLRVLEGTLITSEREFETHLTRLPGDLDGLYEKILGSSPDITKAKKILHVVVAATRPLTLGEMNIALAIQPHHMSVRDLEPNLLPPASTESSLKEICGFFIRVIDSKIYLVHRTAKGFLIKDREAVCDNPYSGAWKHSLDPIKSNLVIANICLRYLSLADSEARPVLGATSSEEAGQCTSQHTFLDYATKNLAGHLRKAQLKQGGKFAGIYSEIL